MVMRHLTGKHGSLLATLALGIAGYTALWAFLVGHLHFAMLIGDVNDYWDDSVRWKQPFHRYHVPLYPLVLALVRGLTLHSLSPITVEGLVNFVAFVGALVLVWKIVFHLTANPTTALALGLLFAFWPFVGLTYTLYPQADTPVIFLVSLGVYLLLQERLWPAALAFGLACITHKASWFLIFPLVLTLKRPARERLRFAAVCLAPLFVLWLGGWQYHHNPKWLLESNLKTEIHSRGTSPVLDGVLGTLHEGGTSNLLKVGVILGTALLGLMLFFRLLKSNPPEKNAFLSVIIGIEALVLLLNRWEIWAAVRFGRLLVLPFAAAYASGASARLKSRTSSKSVGTSTLAPGWIGVLVLCLLTQFAYGRQMVSFFAGVRADSAKKAPKTKTPAPHSIRR